MVIGVALVVEEIVPERDTVRPATGTGQEVRALEEEVLVVTALCVAHAAERIGPVARVAAAPIEQQRAALNICEPGTGTNEFLMAVRVTALDENVRRQDAGVVEGEQILREVACAETGQ